jgi:hypothetical protein
MMMEPNCSKRACKHFIGIGGKPGKEETQKLICKAFPNGIPVEISYGSNLHFEPTKSQENKIVFEE